jgi:hypothetical protein
MLDVSLGGAERVTIRVSPTVAMAPALLTIRTTIEPNDDNRLLRVNVDSGGYSTSSDIPLEGRSAPRLNVVQVKNVPSGVYEVRAVLVGSTGPRATTMQLVRIAPAAGQPR